jgi:stalled ribosome rescue protein Dom34
MATNAGIWIDHKQATVVLLTDGGQEIRKFKSGLEQSKRPAGTRKKGTQYTPNDFIAEDKRERKIEGEHHRFYDDVIACIRGAKAVLVVGPGEAKGEFSKHIKNKKVRGVTVELETTDKLTDRQLAAKVSEHFTKVPAGKSVAPKKSATRAAKSTAGKRTTKPGR